MSDDDNNHPQNLAKNILDGLNDRERKILKDKFGIDLSGENSLEEIKKAFEITRKNIEEIEQKARKKLEDPNNSDSDPDHEQ